jgi:alpha-amylase
MEEPRRDLSRKSRHRVPHRTGRHAGAGPRVRQFREQLAGEQGYAQILTHPGVPTVYWKHYFDWGSDLRSKIRALINARKVAGVHAGSQVSLQGNVQATGIYAARIIGRNGDLYVRVGGDDSQWQPAASGYANYREYAQGEGWKVWVGLPGNPGVQQTPFRAALPLPEYRDAQTITVPESLLQAPGAN